MIGSLQLLKKRAGVSGFLEQYGEWRDVVVPLDERRTRAEPNKCFLVERPDFAGHAGAVIVDAQRIPIIELPNRVPRQVNFTDGVRWQRREIRERVPAMIAAADVDVVDIAQDAGACPL